MKKGKTRFLVPLIAVCVLLIGAGSAFAQTDAIVYQITSTPTFVINTGRAEVLGTVRITAQTASAAPIATTAEFLYENTPCDNDATNGIGLTALSSAGGVGDALADAVVSTVSNTAGGCVVAVTIEAAKVVTVADFLQVEGVRGRVDLANLALGADVNVRLNATPSGSALFTAPSIVRVATTAVGLIAAVTNGTVLFCTGPPPAPLPSIVVTEGFNGAFVQHVVTAPGATAVPADFRPATGVATTQGGGINNTQIALTITNIPAGVVLAFPAAVAGINIASGAASAGVLDVVTSTVVGTSQTVIYEFGTSAQGTSDINTEAFTITPVVTLPATLILGAATVQVRLFPDLIAGDATTATTVPFDLTGVVSLLALNPAKPRFNDPLLPATAAALVTVNPCSTNLLFPWAPNIAGFDTGIAIANTSTDATAFPALATPTVAQGGTCTLHGFTAADATAVTFTTPSIASGTTFTTSLSSATNPALNGFAGYIIAVCQFQFAHGFAFISDSFGQAPSQAQGYLALVIPDPFVTGGARGAITAGGGTAQEGEGLGQ